MATDATPDYTLPAPPTAIAVTDPSPSKLSLDNSNYNDNGNDKQYETLTAVKLSDYETDRNFHLMWTGDSMFAPDDDGDNASVRSVDNDQCSNTENDYHGNINVTLANEPIDMSSQPVCNQEYFYSLDEILFNLPKEDFVEKLLAYTKRSDEDICMYRSILLKRARDIDNCPEGSLIQRRTTKSEESCVRFASDCYTIQDYIDNGDPKWLNDILVKRRTTYRSPANDTVPENMQCTSILAVQQCIAEMQSKIQLLVQDVVNLKNENAKQKEVIKSLSENVEIYVKLLHNSIDEDKRLRAIDSRKFKAIRCEMDYLKGHFNIRRQQNLADTVTKSTAYATTTGPNTVSAEQSDQSHSNLAKRSGVVSSLSGPSTQKEQRAKCEQSCIQIPAADPVSSPIPGPPPMSSCTTWPPLSTVSSSATGSASVLSTPPVGSVSTSLDRPVHKSSTGLKPAPSVGPAISVGPSATSGPALHVGSEPSSATSATESMPTSSVRPADVLHTGPSFAPATGPIGSVPPPNRSSMFTMSRSYALTTSTVSANAKPTSSVGHNIPVRVSERANPVDKRSDSSKKLDTRRAKATADTAGDAESYDDVTQPIFESVKSRRTVRYYVGGIASHSNRSGLINFLNFKCIEPVGVRLINTNRDNIAAKLTVSQSDSRKVEDRKFWPGQMYCRRWYSESKWQTKTGVANDKQSVIDID